jgi:hypothetical protein
MAGRQASNNEFVKVLKGVPDDLRAAAVQWAMECCNCLHGSVWREKSWLESWREWKEEFGPELELPVTADRKRTLNLSLACDALTRAHAREGE